MLSTHQAIERSTLDCSIKWILYLNGRQFKKAQNNTVRTTTGCKSKSLLKKCTKCAEQSVSVCENECGLSDLIKKIKKGSKKKHKIIR